MRFLGFASSAIGWTAGEDSGSLFLMDESTDQWPSKIMEDGSRIRLIPKPPGLARDTNGHAYANEFLDVISAVYSTVFKLVAEDNRPAALDFVAAVQSFSKVASVRWQLSLIREGKKKGSLKWSKLSFGYPISLETVAKSESALLHQA